jgi:hypothetical protein
VNEHTGKKVIVNTSPIAELLKKTNISTGCELTRLIDKVKDCLILGWNPEGHVDYDCVQHNYYFLKQLSDAFAKLVIIDIQDGKN